MNIDFIKKYIYIIIIDCIKTHYLKYLIIYLIQYTVKNL